MAMNQNRLNNKRIHESVLLHKHERGMLLQTNTNKHKGSDGIRNYQWKLKPVGESLGVMEYLLSLNLSPHKTYQLQSVKY